MTISIACERPNIDELTSAADGAKLSPMDRSTMLYCLTMSESSWVGRVDGELACVLGLVPPTIMSERAYLWMYHTEVAAEHKFLLVRHSQRMVEELLKKYPYIHGHCLASAESSLRWLRWLGAEFYPPEGHKIPFLIRSRERG